MEKYFGITDWRKQRNGIVHTNDDGTEVAFYMLSNRFEYYLSNPETEDILEFKMIYPDNFLYNRIAILFIETLRAMGFDL